MPLTIAQKSSVRRHLGYPAIGLYSVGAGGATLGNAAASFRYFQAYGFLEYKMNNLNPDEEARLTGQAYGGIALPGPQPTEGNTLTLVLAGPGIPSPQTMVVTAGPPINVGSVQTDMRLNLIAAMAAAIATNPILTAARIMAAAPYGTGPYAQQAVPVPELAIISPVAFTLSVTGTGTVAPEISADGSLLPPSTSLDGVNTIFGYVPILDGLESAFYSTSQNLDTIKADVWSARSNEIGQRMSLYKMTIGQLVDFIGIPLNPYRRSRPSRQGAIRYA